MQLSKKNIEQIQPVPGLVLPEKNVFDLPEKVLQFGTGVLLRGLPDYFIDKANRQGIFNGRIVVVKSTAAGGADAFDRQDGLYTLCVRGIEQGKQVEENIVHAAISRVLSAASAWEEILACAANPDMQVVISNTTEVGITLVRESIYHVPPSSFPGKLLAFLYKRYETFGGNAGKGMVILPAELITDNGKKLKEIVLELAAFNQLGDGFITWLREHNYFCNTLVDRIVPGRLPATEQQQTEEALGYSDELMIMSEAYRLWAIEAARPEVQEILSFAKADAGVVITDDITRFKELKLRLLNGSHTFTCALALLQGFTTVKEAMADKGFVSFIRLLMEEEIVPAITGGAISREEAVRFAHDVLDRYRNPCLEHEWSSIAVQYTSKMRLRCLPLIRRYYEQTGRLPEKMARGFAAYLLWARSRHSGAGTYEVSLNGKKYALNDQYAPVLAGHWAAQTYAEALVKAVVADEQLWGNELPALPGWAEMVGREINALQNEYLSDLTLIIK